MRLPLAFALALLSAWMAAPARADGPPPDMSAAEVAPLDAAVPSLERAALLVVPNVPPPYTVERYTVSPGAVAPTVVPDPGLDPSAFAGLLDSLFRAHQWAALAVALSLLATVLLYRFLYSWMARAGAGKWWGKIGAWLVGPRGSVLYTVLKSSLAALLGDAIAGKMSVEGAVSALLLGLSAGGVWALIRGGAPVTVTITSSHPGPVIPPDDPPKAPYTLGAGHGLVLLLGLSLLGVVPGCAAAQDCMRQLAQGPQPLHTGDEVLDQVDAARAAGVAPDSPAWQQRVDEWVKVWQPCRLIATVGDLLGHLAAGRIADVGQRYTVDAVVADCARCHAHHAHPPRDEDRAYLEKALVQLKARVR
jgi:hypothetical protein